MTKAKISNKIKKNLKLSALSLGFFVMVLVLMLGVVLFKAPVKKVASHEKPLPLHESSASAVVAIASPTPKPIVYSGFCQNVPILMYHHIEPLDEATKEGHPYLAVEPRMFDMQMGYLASSGYRSISADELVNAMIAHQRLGKVVVVTLDDGYNDAYTNAYPVLSKYHIIGNLMIPTGLLGNSDYLTWEQLKRMVGSGTVFAYDHTWSHANIPSLPDDKAKKEILTARSQLEEELGKKVNIFAYPYGGEDTRSVNILRANGFIAAISTIPGVTQCDSFIMSLHRTRIGNAPLPSYGL